MNRFFTDKFNGENFIIDDPGDVKHITKVLRLREGEVVEIVHDGTEYTAEISEIDSEITLFSLGETGIKRESDLEITVIQGLPKGERLDYVLMKNTELGVNKFYLIEMERSVAKLKRDKSDRFRKIVREAAKQSKRTAVPDVCTFSNLMTIDYGKFDIVYVLYEGRPEDRIVEVSGYNKIALIVGPEGGISDDEMEYLSKIENVKVVTLGNRILRTETASVSAVSIIQHLMGDM